MSVNLEIPPTLFERLQRLAIPLVDTPITVIERLADHYEATSGQSASRVTPSNHHNQGRVLNPLDPPDLLHTRVEGTFGAHRFRKWNELVRIAHVEAFRKAGNFEALRRVSQSKIRNGNHGGDSGFHYIAEIDISVQGVDARHAWTYTLCLARYTRVPMYLTVTWRNNEKAAYPGETGILEWKP